MSTSSINNSLEKKLLSDGFSYVVGFDEVGRGSWAGPVAVGAYVFSKSTKLFPEVDDSKNLTKLQREKIYKKFSRHSYLVQLGNVKLIDKVNILEATRIVITKAFNQLNLDNAIALIDGQFSKGFDFEYRCIKAGDQKHYSIAAASILAKVERDNLMTKLSKKYRGYGFDTNVGYGTKKHREGLEKYGVCEIHRKSYKPVREAIGLKESK